MIKLCLFDCDGTLVDGLHGIHACLVEAFVSLALPAPAHDAVRRIVGLSVEDAIARLAPNRTATDVARLSEAFISASISRHRGSVRPDELYPGVIDCLIELEDAEWLLGIATGKSHAGARATLTNHGIEERFATLQTPDVAAAKPAPDMVLRAMAETGATVDATVVVGDTTYDMEMARNAGVRAIGVGWGYHGTDELLATGAHALAASFADLLPLAERLVASPAKASG